MVVPSVCRRCRCPGASGRTAPPHPNAFCVGAEVPGPRPTGFEKEPVGSFENRPNGGVPHARGRRLALPWAQRALSVSWAHPWDVAVSTCARHSARGPLFVLLVRHLPPPTHKRPDAPSSGHGGAAPGPELMEPFPNPTCICFSSSGGWVFPSSPPCPLQGPRIPPCCFPPTFLLRTHRQGPGRTESKRPFAPPHAFPCFGRGGRKRKAGICSSVDFKIFHH